MARMTQGAEAPFVGPPTLVEALSDELRRRVLRGEYRPGERVSEERVATELKVSRPPLREAMRLLQRDGLLTGLPRRGVFVTPLTADDVREIYSLRHALEDLAIDLAVPLESPDRLEPLREALRDLESAAARKDRDALPLLNLRFHQALTRLPGHKRLERAYDSLAAQLQMCMAMNLRFRERLYGNPAESVERHALLLRLLESGDREAAKRAMREHGDRSFLEGLEQLLDADSELGRRGQPR